MINCFTVLCIYKISARHSNNKKGNPQTEYLIRVPDDSEDLSGINSSRVSVIEKG